MKPGVLLYVAELLEPSVAVRAFVWFLAGVDPDMLDELVVRTEGLQALLALVWLHLAAQPSLQFAGVHLHGVLMHEYSLKGRPALLEGSLADALPGPRLLIDIQAIQEIYQSERQHRVAVADRHLPCRRLLLRQRIRHEGSLAHRGVGRW